MKPLETATNIPLELPPTVASLLATPGEGSPPTPDACAGMLLDTVPVIMRALRQMHRGERSNFTVPQFRALLFVQRHEGASLSEAAEFLGLTLPSASKLVDALVKREFLARENDLTDRRRILLKVTRRGNSLLKDVHQAVRQQLAAVLNRFSPAELAALRDTLELLQRSFPAVPAESAPVKEPSTSRQV